MEGAIIWLAMALIVGWISSNKGRSFMGWFIYGLFLWPIAIIHIALLSAKSKKCPKCYSEIDTRASVCKHCQHVFTPEETKAFHKARIKSRNIQLIIFTGIGFLFLLIYSSAQNSKPPSNNLNPATVSPKVDEKWVEDAAKRYYDSHISLDYGPQQFYDKPLSLETAKELMQDCLEELETKEDCENIIDKKYWIGMPKIWAIMSVGNPNDINTTVTGDRKHEQFIYGDPIYGATYLYFDDDVLTSYQD